MSLGSQQPRSFLEPLMGRTATFLLGGRQENLIFARVLAGLLRGAGEACTIMDLDAFYSSHADLILAPTSGEAGPWTLRVPPPGSDIEVELSRLFDAPQGVLIIDSLNTLYHLLSLNEGSSRGRRLAFALAGLSYLARTSSRAVILTMYRREGFGRIGTGRSISALSDTTASVEVNESDLSVRSERGSAWPSGAFSTRIP